jgi:hypothetical protein|nr:MAG TPA: hypothetical protein [Caudoviricetes sp.]
MTNKQKIAELETKLRRYEKRTGDLQKLNAKLAAQVVGSTQIGKAVDAILIQTALTYGEAAIDPDTGEEIGKRLTLPPVDVSELLKRYEVHARRDSDGQYIIGVGLRDDPNDHKGGNA